MLYNFKREMCVAYILPRCVQGVVTKLFPIFYLYNDNNDNDKSTYIASYFHRAHRRIDRPLS